MRVIAGQYRSRTIQSLPGRAIRPTSDKLRETLFNVLAQGDPQRLEGSVWIDLFSGTGAVGIEALSRGASLVQFVEQDRKHADLIEKNLKGLGITAGYRIIADDALRGLRKIADSRTGADYIFLDPPYAKTGLCAQTLERLGSGTLLQVRGTVIAEHEAGFSLPEECGGLRRFRTLEQGDSTLSFYRSAS